jgi:predicted RNA binding protein YcfA (HicA-like mRNA interferase family)
MSRSPRVTGSELIAALVKDGFEVVRIRGSHRLLRHEDGRTTVVPVHSGETIGPGLLHKILRDCQLQVEELRALIDSR